MHFRAVTFVSGSLGQPESEVLELTDEERTELAQARREREERDRKAQEEREQREREQREEDAIMESPLSAAVAVGTEEEAFLPAVTCTSSVDGERPACMHADSPHITEQPDQMGRQNHLQSRRGQGHESGASS